MERDDATCGLHYSVNVPISVLNYSRAERKVVVKFRCGDVVQNSNSHHEVSALSPNNWPDKVA